MRWVHDQIVIDVIVETFPDLETAIQSNEFEMLEKIPGYKYLKAEEETETNHGEKWHEFERVLDRFAEGDYVSTEAEQLHVLEKEWHANPCEEDRKRADGSARPVIEAWEEWHDCNENGRKLKPVVNRREVVEKVVAEELKELFAQMNQHNHE